MLHGIRGGPGDAVDNQVDGCRLEGTTRLGRACMNVVGCWKTSRVFDMICWTVDPTTGVWWHY